VVSQIQPKFIDVDFEIKSEPWNVYRLANGPLLKQRFILTRLLVNAEDPQKLDFKYKRHVLTEISSLDQSLYGEPSESLPPRHKFREYATHKIRFDIEKEDWNEYITTSGIQIRIKNTLALVQLTSLYDEEGEPIFIANSTQQILITPPSEKEISE
jgi:hypothetical protein